MKFIPHEERERRIAEIARRLLDGHNVERRGWNCAVCGQDLSTRAWRGIGPECWRAIRRKKRELREKTGCAVTS